MNQSKRNISNTHVTKVKRIYVYYFKLRHVIIYLEKIRVRRSPLRDLVTSCSSVITRIISVELEICDSIIETIQKI